MNTSRTKEQLLKLEELVEFSFELVTKAMQMWRTYRETTKAKGQKIRMGIEIHKMIMDAMKINPDMKSVKELSKHFDEVKAELDLAKRTFGDERRPKKTEYQKSNR